MSLSLKVANSLSDGWWKNCHHLCGARPRCFRLGAKQPCVWAIAPAATSLFSMVLFFFFLPFFSLKVPDSEVPPWISSSSSGGGTGGRNNADISSVWNTDEKFRQSILEELLKDCLHMEVAGIVSATLVVSRVVVAYLLMIQFRYSIVPIINV